MRITRLHIKNFRLLKVLDIELGDTTVFIGPNNAGKTAILDAVRIALTRRWGQRGTGFTEYDIHLENEESDPKQSPGVSIELHAEEREKGEWSAELRQDLTGIYQPDPATGKNSIVLRVSCAWNAEDESFQPVWQFLNAAREPLTGDSARRINLESFWRYLPVFYLGALRDADDEFSSRSQFWGRLLKAMNIPSELETQVQSALDKLNSKLLKADPRLKKIADTLSGATRVAARSGDGEVDLRLVPLKSWDLLSKAQIIMRNERSWPWLPLQRHGQGVQSLSVIFLFQAFVEHLLSELYEDDSAPVLALEEPETHLHPHAARTLWAHVNNLPGQKIITTHSPYFVQHVSFRDLRLVRLTDSGTEVRSLPESFSAQDIPHVEGIDAVVSNGKGFLRYERVAETLTVHGKLEKNLYKKLLRCYSKHPEKTKIHERLRELLDRSSLFINNDELRKLETFARRIRGEIFFAHRWLIVEGQAEYLLVSALAREIGYDLDEHGVSLIDSMNNGNPKLFTALAQALGIPWLVVLDGDCAGKKRIREIKSRIGDADLAKERCRTHSAGNLEQQLLSDGLESKLRDALLNTGHKDAEEIDSKNLKSLLKKHKTEYAAELALMLHGNSALASYMPEAFRNAIKDLGSLE